MEKLPEDIELQFNPEGKNVIEIEKDQIDMVELFEIIESELNLHKKQKKNWIRNSEFNQKMNRLLLIEILWKRSRKKLSEITNIPYKETSLIQYRMESFLNKRREIRDKLREIEKEEILESNDESIGDHKKRRISEILKIETLRENSNNQDLNFKKKNKSNTPTEKKKKQKSLKDYF